MVFHLQICIKYCKPFRFRAYFSSRTPKDPEEKKLLSGKMMGCVTKIKGLFFFPFFSLFPSLSLFSITIFLFFSSQVSRRLDRIHDFQAAKANLGIREFCDGKANRRVREEKKRIFYSTSSFSTFISLTSFLTLRASGLGH